MVKKILLGIVIVIVLIFVGLVIFINTFNLNKYLPQITQQASKAIGREVKIERAHLHFSLLKGVAASVEGIFVGEDPQFGNRPFLTVGNIRCGVRFMPLVTKRQVEVSYVTIQSPEITLIKGTNGKFNFESLMKAAQPADASSAPSTGGGSSAPAPANLPVLLVNSFRLEKAKVTYADQSFNPPMEFAAKDIDIEVTDFSLTEAFKIKADASLFSAQPNVHVNGLGRIDMNLQQIRLDDVHMNADLSAIDVAKLNKTVAALEPVGLQSIQGQFNATTSQMLAGAGGLLVLSLEAELSDGQVRLKMLGAPLDKITMKFDASESKINVKEFSLNLATGEVHGQGVVNDYMTTQEFEFNVDVKEIPLETALDQKAYPAQIKGSLSGNTKISGAGFTPEALEKMIGQSTFTILNGELVGMNILQSVLGRITIIPGLADAVESQLSAELRQKIGGKNTKIDKADVRTRIANSNVLIDEAQVEAQGFRLSANGRAGFDQTLAMKAEMVLLKELAGALMASAKQMAALADENGEIHIPVNITGKLPSLSFMPDMNYLSKRLIVNEGSKHLDKVIEKNPEVKQILDIFTGGGKKSSQPAETQDETSDPESAPSEEQSPEKKLLNSIFKGF
jgi:uncharacterized protein involved in outer membrane biogenesis